MFDILAPYLLWLAVVGVVLALLSIYCLCRVAGRDQRRAAALLAEQLAAEQHAAYMER